MSRLTPGQIARIPELTRRGLSCQQIADEIGCGPVAVWKRQQAMGLRNGRDTPQGRAQTGALALSLDPDTARLLRGPALARQTSVARLCAALLETIANDGLVGAVLDEEGVG